jgi:hypothetical protein
MCYKIHIHARANSKHNFLTAQMPHLNDNVDVLTTSTHAQMLHSILNAQMPRHQDMWMFCW